MPNENIINELSASDELSVNDDEIIEVNNTVDNEYLSILELNINNLQSELQNIKDNLIPKVNQLQLQLDEKNKDFYLHQKQTKNSFQILEDRMSKLILILESSKL